MAKRSRRRLISWLVLVVLLSSGILGYRYLNHHEDQQVQLDTVLAERGDVTSRVTATGTLSALVTVDVGSQVSGRIQDLYADFNSVVEQGQVLARLDPQLFQAALEQEDANYSAARAGLVEAETEAAEAERQAQRSTNLAQRNLIAEADADSATAAAEVARARVESARASVRQARARRDQARLNLDYTTILSPIHGVVISRDVDVGQTVAASLQAPTLFVLAEDLSRMQVDTTVAESDVGRLQPGMRATFTVDAYPDLQFEGTVRQIRNAPQTVQNVVTYNAVIDVQNDGLKLLPGMTANVSFVVAQRLDTLRIPNSALRFRPTEELRAQWAEATRPAGGAAEGQAGRAWQGQGQGTGRAAPPAGAGLPERPAAGGESRLHNRTVQTEPSGQATGEAQADRRFLWVVRDGVPQRIAVRLGISDGSYSEVIGGDLREGDEIITGISGEQGENENSPRGGPPGFRML